jgi:hypothetical protein
MTALHIDIQTLTELTQAGVTGQALVDACTRIAQSRFENAKARADFAVNEMKRLNNEMQHSPPVKIDFTGLKTTCP